MIVQSPESTMPEPYRSYVRQRSESIANVLHDVVGDVDVQLCPRAITPEERVFSQKDGHVYGVVVKDVKDGYKSVLYSAEFGSQGIATNNHERAIAYAEEQFRKGNRIRLKDPHESDGNGQYAVESIEELLPHFHQIIAENKDDCVLMPHLREIRHRISVGHISLGALGRFCYLGQESTAKQDNSEVYGGTLLGLFRDNELENEVKTKECLEIPDHLVRIGKVALAKYSHLALWAGRVSIDVIEGVTDNGEKMCEAVDVTPRMGGTTPAEVLALREIYKCNQAICFASSQLIYSPAQSPGTGTNFLDTKELVINAQVHEVIA